jgi:hypothetical protein
MNTVGYRPNKVELQTCGGRTSHYRTFWVSAIGATAAMIAASAAIGGAIVAILARWH